MARIVWLHPQTPVPPCIRVEQRCRVWVRWTQIETQDHISRETRISVPGFPGPPQRPRGKDAGNCPVGFSQAPAPLSRTSGHKHLPFAFVAQPGPASHPSAAAPGTRPICALPRPGGRSVPTVQRAQSGIPSAPAGALAGNDYKAGVRTSSSLKSQSQIAAGSAGAKVQVCLSSEQCRLGPEGTGLGCRVFCLFCLVGWFLGWF